MACKGGVRRKLTGHFDPFYPKPKLLGPHSQHPCFVVAELWTGWDTEHCQICTNSMGNGWGPELAYNMCIAYFILHSNKMLFGGEIGVRN